PRVAPMSSFKEKGLTVRPYGELVAAGIAEVKAAAARERVRPAHDRAAGLRDLRLGRFQRGGVNHHQRTGGPARRLLPAPAAPPATSRMTPLIHPARATSWPRSRRTW